MNRLESWTSQIASVCINPAPSTERRSSCDLDGLYVRCIREREIRGRELTALREHLIQETPLCGIYELTPIELATFEALLAVYHPMYSVIQAANQMARNLYVGIALRAKITCRGNPPCTYIESIAVAPFSWGLKDMRSIAQDFPIFALPTELAKKTSVEWVAFEFEVIQRFFLDQMERAFSSLEREVQKRLKLKRLSGAIDSATIRALILDAAAMVHLGPEHTVSFACYIAAHLKAEEDPLLSMRILLAEKVLQKLQPDQTYPFDDIFKAFKYNREDLSVWSECLDCVVSGLVGDCLDEIGGQSMMDLIGWDWFDNELLPKENKGKYIAARYFRWLFRRY